MTDDCGCHFCSRDKPHPETHRDWGRVSNRLLVAESLKPEDSVARYACNTCGHITEVEPYV